MDGSSHVGVPEPRHDARRTEPRRMTMADLAVMIAAVALVMAIPARTAVWPPYIPAPAILLILIRSLRLTQEVGLAFALVVLYRRARYGGPVRPAEFLALGLASLNLLEAVPNLDDMVNAYYATVGTNVINFGIARRMLAAPAASCLGLIVGGLIILRRRVNDGSRVASASNLIGIVAVLCLWFWGPCEVARLQLPTLLVPSPPGEPTTWGWLGTVVFTLREAVEIMPRAIVWGVIAAVTVRAWSDRRGWLWTEWAALVDGGLAAFLLLAAIIGRGPVESGQWALFMVVIGLASWWISGRLAPSVRPLPAVEPLPRHGSDEPLPGDRR